MSLGLDRDELALQARAREFATSIVRPRAAAIDRDEQYPWDIVRALAEAKFLGMSASVMSLCQRGESPRHVVSRHM